MPKGRPKTCCQNVDTIEIFGYTFDVVIKLSRVATENKTVSENCLFFCCYLTINL